MIKHRVYDENGQFMTKIWKNGQFMTKIGQKWSIYAKNRAILA